MKVVYGALTALAVLSLEAEARIGAQRKLQSELLLDVVGNNGDFPNGPLGLCQGECDTDDECAEGLVCFQREANQPIPGCPDFGPGFDSKGDFCVKSPEEMPEEPEEEDEEPEEPEEEPEGSSDQVPEEVPADTPVPTEESVAPEETPAPTEVETSVPTEMETVAETMVESMEDTSGEIRAPPPPIMASEAPTDTETPAPTELVSVADTMTETMVDTMGDSMADSTGTGAPIMAAEKPGDEPGILELAGQDGVGAFPLGMCKGDCDNDRECGEGLICWQRDMNDPVPGCIGSLEATTDFCVLAKYGDGNEDGSPAPSGTMVPTGGDSFEYTDSPTEI